MLKRLRLSPQTFMLLEAGLIGIFFIQALRFLVGMLYTRTAGASVALALQTLGIEPVSPDLNVPDPALVSSEISFTLVMLGLPLLTLVLGRIRLFILLGVLLVVVGRVLMNLTAVLTPTASAALAVGGGLFYLAYLVRYRANLLPYMFIIGLSVDQLYRAAGNTLDPSWSSAYAPVQIGLGAATITIALIAYIWSARQPRLEMPNPAYGMLPFWGGIGLGGLLFVELALLAIPNAAAGRSDYDYTILVPFLVAATLLPTIPAVRVRFRTFLGTFDGSVRGWLWMLIVILLIVFGTRFQGILAGAALVAAQFAVTMMWWWLTRPRTQTDRSFNGLWLSLGMLIFTLLVTFDLFTYEYAYVRNFSGDLAFLNEIVTPFLRGFRGLGLAVIILGTFLAALPMTQTRRRIPWTGGSGAMNILTIVVVIGASFGAAYLARPPVVQSASGLETIRFGTYNIHGGTDEFFNPNLDRLANTIFESGADVVLLQEVESGRLTSFGVDQSLWLARRLGMDRRFFPTLEGTRGLAVLSNVPIAYDDGELLSGSGEQTGLQRVQILPDGETLIEVYNTWLTYLLEPTSGNTTLEAQEQEQQQQLNQIFQIIADQHPNGVLGRTVIGGTFNNVPDSPLMQQMRAVGFSDPFAGLPVELAATLVRSGVPRARLDYVWLRNLTPSEGVLVLPNFASDHRLAITGVLAD